MRAFKWRHPRLSALGRLRRFGTNAPTAAFWSICDTQTAPLPLFLSLLFAEGLATQLDPVRVVNDAVQDGVRERGITDHVMQSFDWDLLVISVAPRP